MMGRAYPSMEHGTPYVYGHPITPVAIADAKGNVSVVMVSPTSKHIVDTSDLIRMPSQTLESRRCFALHVSSSD
jgi:DUF917 family protein